MEKKIRHLRVWAGLLGALAVAVGVGCLIGWMTNTQILLSVIPGLTTMKPNAGLSVALLGASLCMMACRAPGRSKFRLADVPAGAAVVVGVLTLLERDLQLEVGIDDLLPLPVTVADDDLIGMSGMAALCIVAIGAGLLLIDRAERTVRLLAILAVAVSTLTLLGYIYGVQAFYRAMPFTVIALNSAVAFLLLATGLLLARPGRHMRHILTSDSSGGFLARRLLPATALVPLVVAWLRIKGEEAGIDSVAAGLPVFSLITVFVMVGLVWWNARLLDRSDDRRRAAEHDREVLLDREQVARRRAEEAVLARDQLLSVVSHELRTPLTPVLLIASSLEKQPNIPQEMTEDLRVIREQVELETRLIGDLLDLVSLRQRKLMLDMQPMDLHEALAHTASVYRPMMAEKQITLLLDLSATRTRLVGDSGRLRQVIRNLLDNAMKFTADGGHVALRSFDFNGSIGIEVSDNGIGMDQKTLKRVFAPFEQADPSTTRRHGGLGIGLAISRRLVEMHGGTLSATSGGVGKGCTFRVELPAGDLRPAPVPVTRNDRREADRPVTPGCRVLLVEDNDTTRAAIKKLLANEGHAVIDVACVEAALAVPTTEWDLLLSDIGLPDQSGWELMRQLRQSGPVRGIAFSGFVDETDRQKSLDAGFAAHLNKPVELDRLLAAMRTVMADEAAVVS